MTDVTIRPWRWVTSWDLYDAGQWRLEAVWAYSDGITRSLTIERLGAESDHPSQTRTGHLTQVLTESIEEDPTTHPWLHGILDHLCDDDECYEP